MIANDAPDIIYLESDQQGAFLISKTELTLPYEGLTVQSNMYKVNKDLCKYVALSKQYPNTGLHEPCSAKD